MDKGGRVNGNNGRLDYGTYFICCLRNTADELPAGGFNNLHMFFGHVTPIPDDGSRFDGRFFEPGQDVLDGRRGVATPIVYEMGYWMMVSFRGQQGQVHLTAFDSFCVVAEFRKRTGHTIEEHRCEVVGHRFRITW